MINTGDIHLWLKLFAFYWFRITAVIKTITLPGSADTFTMPKNQAVFRL